MKEFIKSVFKLTTIMLLIVGVIFGAAFVWLKSNGKEIELPQINPFEGLVTKEESTGPFANECWMTKK